jgi:twitching motility protein PilI
MSSAIDLLAELEQRIQSDALELPENVGSGVWQAVAFEQSGSKLALDMEYISEVLPLPPSTRLPGVRNWVVGIANLRGQILPLIDFGALLDQSPAISQPLHRVLVVRNDTAELGLVVDRVVGMKQVDDTSSTGEISGFADFVQPYCSGNINVDGESFALLDLAKVFNSAKFKHIVVV